MGFFDFLSPKVLKLDNPSDGHAFLSVEKDIVKWLKKMGIKNYNLIADMNGDLFVDVNGDVQLRGKNLIFIPVRFNNVSGFFSCSQNKLVTLKGCPKSVGDGFFCYQNALIDLVGAPETVGHKFDCHNNLLINLKGAPEEIPEDFNCQLNFLETLENCPKTIGQDLDVRSNSLKHLDFLPNSVGRFFFYESNYELENDYGNKTDNLVFANIKEISQAKREKKNLTGILDSIVVPHQPPKVNKL